MKSLSLANLLIFGICTYHSSKIEGFTSSYLNRIPSRLYDRDIALFSSTLEKENVRVQDWVAYLDSKNKGKVIYYNTKTSDSILWFPPKKGSEHKKNKIMDMVNCDPISMNNIEWWNEQNRNGTKMIDHESQAEMRKKENTKIRKRQDKQSIKNGRWIEFETKTNKKMSLFFNMETGEIVRKRRKMKKTVSNRIFSPHFAFNRHITADRPRQGRKKDRIHKHLKIVTHKKNAIFTAPEPINEQTKTKQKKVRYTATTNMKKAFVQTKLNSQRQIYKTSVERSSVRQKSGPFSKFVKLNDEKCRATKTKEKCESAAGKEKKNTKHSIDFEEKKSDIELPLFVVKESTPDKCSNGNSKKIPTGKTHDSTEYFGDVTKPDECISKEKYQKLFNKLETDNCRDSTEANDKSKNLGRKESDFKRHSSQISDNKVMEAKKKYKNTYSSIPASKTRKQAQAKLNDGLDITMNIFGMVPREKKSIGMNIKNSYKEKDNDIINTNNEPYSFVGSDEALVSPPKCNKKNETSPNIVSDELIFPYLVEKGEEGCQKSNQTIQAPEEIIIDVIAETIGVSSFNENPKAHGKAAFHKFFVTNSYDFSSSVHWGQHHVSSLFDQDPRPAKTNEKSSTKSLLNKKSTTHADIIDSTGIYSESFTDIEQEIMEEIQRERKEREDLEKTKQRIEEEKDKALTSFQENLQSRHKCKKVLSHYPALFDL